MGVQRTAETPSTHLCPSITHCADNLGTARVQGRPCRPLGTGGPRVPA